MTVFNNVTPRCNFSTLSINRNSSTFQDRNCSFYNFSAYFPGYESSEWKPGFRSNPRRHPLESDETDARIKISVRDGGTRTTEATSIVIRVHVGRKSRHSRDKILEIFPLGENDLYSVPRDCLREFLRRTATVKFVRGGSSRSFSRQESRDVGARLETRDVIQSGVALESRCSGFCRAWRTKEERPSIPKLVTRAQSRG